MFMVTALLAIYPHGAREQDNYGRLAIHSVITLDVFHALVKVNAESLMPEDRYGSLPLPTVLIGVPSVSDISRKKLHLIMLREDNQREYYSTKELQHSIGRDVSAIKTSRMDNSKDISTKITEDISIFYQIFSVLQCHILQN